ncbi:hypothetical protein T459_34688 [Capsicum annuum]|uniref:Uncharacterized protein n=1 Tax=Capsicum annuum TaxID=4072 RepID=A0A2G2XVF0_CAPAN|nr:hypothetical protein T459_34688 [Capsicum annuum]
MRGFSPCKYNNYIPFLSSSIIRCYSSVKGKVGVYINVENEVKCLDDAVSLFNRMVRMNPLPSVTLFCKLYKIMINMKHYSSVVSLFQEMRKLRIPINDFMLNILINSYCLMHCVDCAFSVLPIYMKTGIPLDVVTFNTLLRGLFAQNKIRDAVELFKKVVRENICEPNQFMYATVMNGLSKRGHTQKTISLLRLMEQGNTKPNIYNYTIVIDALCKDGNLDGAINLLNEMKQKGIPQDRVIYGSLIDGPCKLGQWEKVRTFFSEMVNLNIYPDVYIFNMVIDGLCKEGKVEAAEEVMEHMIKKGVEPNIITYNVIMDGYCLRGQLVRARRIFDIMIDKCIEPDIFSYSILINGYCKKKKLAKAMQLLGEISQRGSKPNTVTYNTILHGLFKVGRIGDAKRVYAEMLYAGPKPDICTHSTVLDGYFRYGLVEEALSLFNKLERKRENTNIAFYTVVINGLCKNGKLDEAQSVFEKLSLIGLPPNVRTYNTMITGFCREGLLDEAKSMLRKMEKNSCLPDSVTYNVFVQGFLRWSKFSEMRNFMKEMADRGFSFDSSTARFLAKSTVAAAAAALINPQLQIEALQNRVGPETENVFDDTFWENLSVVINALDNVNARLYVDQRCLYFQKPLLESGTLGAKCNTQMVIPHLTENYGASRDPPEKQAPMCTLHSFPHNIDHCLTWARSEFEGLLEKIPAEVNAYLTNPSEYTSAQANAGDAQARDNLERILECLDRESCQTFEDCIAWARLK